MHSEPGPETNHNTPATEINKFWHNDGRIDPRIRSFFAKHPFRANSVDEIMVPMLNSDELSGGEALAPSEGLDVHVEKFISQPDGNEVWLSVIQPSQPGGGQRGTSLPCVVYYHGGGMSKYSCFYNCWQSFARLLAHQGVVVIMPDFRNSTVPAKVGDAVAQFPAGLNDCVSTIDWVHSQYERLGIDKSRITISGESGGGNLTIATALALKQQNRLDLIRGFYAMCPFIVGVLPQGDKYSSHYDNAGIFMVRNNSFFSCIVYSV
jgi:acetyl esterase/lipase